MRVVTPRSTPAEMPSSRHSMALFPHHTPRQDKHCLCHANTGLRQRLIPELGSQSLEDFGQFYAFCDEKLDYNTLRN